MTSSWLPGLSALLAPAVCLTLQASSVSAEACANNSATRWLPQRSWPSACEPDAVTDGLVLLDGDALSADTPGGDGELRITVDRLVAGQSGETFQGKVSRPDA
ncbi:MAG: hypothetical protein JWN04_2740, partial [Myxococcaceae bacterium]|nr:hypothetical protein [Myxococcaceae bacterium]